MLIYEKKWEGQMHYANNGRSINSFWSFLWCAITSLFPRGCSHLFQRGLRLSSSAYLDLSGASCYVKICLYTLSFTSWLSVTFPVVVAFSAILCVFIVLTTPVSYMMGLSISFLLLSYLHHRCQRWRYQVDKLFFLLWSVHPWSIEHEGI